ncbi:MAG: long-chain-fatty-acid--CoA ligase [Pseudomonadota bacterium]
MSATQVNSDVLTPVSFLARTALVYPDKDAVVYGNTRYTYKDFHARVNRLASALLNSGIGPDDKVAVICPNTPPMLEAHFAVPMTGAALVTINVRLSNREVAYILKHSEAKALLVDNEFAGLVASSLGDLFNLKLSVNICDVSDELPLDGMEYEQFLATGSDEPPECAVSTERQVVSINYTSGTTGRPKGVMYHHRGAYLNALGEALEHGLNSRSTYLWTLPMFHCNGWCFPWAVTAVGGTHVCLRKVVPEEIFCLIEQEGVSHLCAAPTVLISMSAYATERAVNVKRPLNVITAGAPPSPTVIKRMEAIGTEVTQVYGLTEVFGPHSICATQAHWDEQSADERAQFKARQGVPYIVAQHMDVVDQETMRPVRRDGESLGEIVMRGNNVMLGYYKQDEATREAFQGGWFHSGDLAVVHPDGYVEIKDRSKDVIISGGENISSVEVENVLYKHPHVQEVAVVGVPDEKWGEVPKAFIFLKPGANPTVEDVVSFCREHLARFKVPKHVEFGELPKTATGKIKKFELRGREWAGRTRKVG